MQSALAQQAPRIFAKPFLKWAGGKSQLLPEILARVPQDFGRYYEPFIGGGAVFFGLQPRQASISDINDRLINTYTVIRDRLPALIDALGKHTATEKHFYAVRAMDPETMSPVEAAARTIFMNRTCFNGLYRVNKKGQFNVPFGRYKNPTICNEENLAAVSDALQGVDIRVASVFDLGRRARKGDFVYLDPPYDPVSKSASFTSYAKNGFGKEEQVRLAQLVTRLANKGVHILLSNSDTPFINDLYKHFTVDKVYARRAINVRSDRRGQVSEVLVSSM